MNIINFPDKSRRILFTTMNNFLDKEKCVELPMLIKTKESSYIGRYRIQKCTNLRDNSGFITQDFVLDDMANQNCFIQNIKNDDNVNIEVYGKLRKDNVRVEFDAKMRCIECKYTNNGIMGEYDLTIMPNKDWEVARIINIDMEENMSINPKKTYLDIDFEQIKKDIIEIYEPYKHTCCDGLLVFEFRENEYISVNEIGMIRGRVLEDNNRNEIMNNIEFVFKKQAPEFELDRPAVNRKAVVKSKTDEIYSKLNHNICEKIVRKIIPRNIQILNTVECTGFGVDGDNIYIELRMGDIRDIRKYFSTKEIELFL